MTFQVLVIPLLLQAATPLALLAWVAVWNPGNRVAWMLPVTATAAYIVAIGIAGLWLALPPHLLWIYAALLAVVVAWKARRQLTLPLMPRFVTALGAAGVVVWPSRPTVILAIVVTAAILILALMTVGILYGFALAPLILALAAFRTDAEQATT
jgi:hypothetical protein